MAPGEHQIIPVAFHLSLQKRRIGTENPCHFRIILLIIYDDFDAILEETFLQIAAVSEGRKHHRHHNHQYKGKKTYAKNNVTGNGRIRFQPQRNIDNGTDDIKKKERKEE